MGARVPGLWTSMKNGKPRTRGLLGLGSVSGGLWGVKFEAKSGVWHGTV